MSHNAKSICSTLLIMQMNTNASLDAIIELNLERYRHHRSRIRPEVMVRPEMLASRYCVHDNLRLISSIQPAQTTPARAAHASHA